MTHIENISVSNLAAKSLGIYIQGYLIFFYSISFNNMQKIGIIYVCTEAMYN